LEILAGALGCVAGIIGFLPYLLLSDVARRKFVEGGRGALMYTMLALVLSFVLMIAAIAICWYVAFSYLVIFAATCVAVFLILTIVYMVIRLKR